MIDPPIGGRTEEEIAEYFRIIRAVEIDLSIVKGFKAVNLDVGQQKHARRRKTCNKSNTTTP